MVGFEKSQVARLIDLVDYQDGAVVSRTIVDKNCGTITLFAFDENQGLSEHTTPFDALIHLLDGQVDITISGEAFRLKEGDMIIMPANQPHALQALQKVKLVLIMVRS